MRLIRGFSFTSQNHSRRWRQVGGPGRVSPTVLKVAGPRRSPLLLSIHGTTTEELRTASGKAGAALARAELRALRSAARSAAACGGWSSAPCGAELFFFLFSYAGRAASQNHPRRWRQVGGPRRVSPTTDNRQPTTDNRQPTTDNRPPTTDHGGPALPF